jgi:four helix bundle protein
VVWQKAHEFVLAVYHLTAKFPTTEIYCFTTQARRAAISIAANIAEGFKKRGLNDKTRFFNIAQGSLEECRYYLILAQDLGYADTGDLEIFLEEVSRLLSAYSLAVRTNKRGIRNFCLLYSAFCILPDKSPMAGEWPVNKKSSSDNVLVRNKSPITAVKAVCAVVAKRKKASGLQRDR